MDRVTKIIQKKENAYTINTLNISIDRKVNLASNA